LSEHWRVVMVLFVVRATVALQFQSVGAPGPLARESFGIGLADFGLLIGSRRSGPPYPGDEGFARDR
jgi:hypothetical protein